MSKNKALFLDCVLGGIGGGLIGYIAVQNNISFWVFLPLCFLMGMAIGEIGFKSRIKNK